LPAVGIRADLFQILDLAETGEAVGVVAVVSRLIRHAVAAGAIFREELAAAMSFQWIDRRTRE
jgi:hypothetical protein